MEALNIKKRKNQFEKVDFVNGMTQHQLKVLVKRLWENFQGLADVCEKDLPEITQTIDTILDGEKWSKKQLEKDILNNQISKLGIGVKK